MQTVIVTGAAGGMGRAIVKGLSQSFNIIAVDNNPEKLNELVKVVNCTA